MGLECKTCRAMEPSKDPLIGDFACLVDPENPVYYRWSRPEMIDCPGYIEKDFNICLACAHHSIINDAVFCEEWHCEVVKAQCDKFINEKNVFDTPKKIIEVLAPQVIENRLDPNDVDDIELKKEILQVIEKQKELQARIIQDKRNKAIKTIIEKNLAEAIKKLDNVKKGKLLENLSYQDVEAYLSSTQSSNESWLLIGFLLGKSTDLSF